jgi:GNAT superfamily N-acetyltransferase
MRGPAKACREVEARKRTSKTGHMTASVREERMTKIEVHPLTGDRWSDLVELFGRPGASIPRWCWCMHYRRSGSDDRRASAAANKRALKTLVDGGTVPGLLGYRNGHPIGWISLGPRPDYPRLANSRVMKAVDDRPVWSIVCFFIDARERGKGISRALLRAAIAYARSRGATLLEAYPVDKRGRSNPVSLWFGAKSLYDRAGFKEVARRKPERPVMRRKVRPVPPRPIRRGAA